MTVLEPRYGYAPGGQADIQLAYIDWGSEQAGPEKTILALHGITANLHCWDALAEKLVPLGYRLIGYDLRGRGDSSQPEEGYSLETHSSDIAALLDYFKLPQGNLVGHSLGALISLWFAANYPERVRHLTLIDAGAPIPPDTFPAIARSLERLGKVFPSLEVYVNQFRGSNYFPAWNDYIERFYTYDARVNPDGTVMCKTAVAAIVDEQKNLAKVDINALLPLIKAPTLLLRATIGLLDDGKAGLVLTADGAANSVAVISANAPARVEAIEDANHYTIIFSTDGARDKVASLITEHLEA
jgi:pimeloyl-ACP methyl ester carboxylesterase